MGPRARIWRWGTFVLIATASSSSTAKLTFCSVTINSSQEREIFRKRLPASDFDFVELTDLQPKDASKVTDGDAWLQAACEKKIQCDVLSISGHFSGHFFGTQSGLVLNLDPAENHTCHKSCEGILKRPREVFLFGCNTLAGKEKDRRTPEEYLRVLLADDIPLAQAQQIVQARYGSLGDSYRERMRRIFSGVPKIYGFDSKGPSGSSVASYLNSYLDSAGNYASHLEDLQGKVAVAAIAKTQVAARTPAQRTIASIFRTTAFDQCAGLDPKDPDFAVKAKLCPLYDDELPLKDRLNHAHGLLQGSDANRLAASVMAFVRSHEVDANGNPELTEVLGRFGRDPKVRELLDGYSKSVAGSPQMAIDLAHFKYVLGIISEDELQAFGRSQVRALFKNVNLDRVTEICSAAEPLRGEHPVKISAEDVDLHELEKPYGATALVCLGSDDPRVTAAVVRSFTKPIDPKYAPDRLRVLSQLPGEDAAKIRIFGQNAGAKDPDVARLANQILFEKGTGDVRRAAFRRWLDLDPNAFELTKAISNRQIKDDQMARAALNKALTKPSAAAAPIAVMANLAVNDSPVWGEALAKTSGNAKSDVVRMMMALGVNSPTLTRTTLDMIARGIPNESLQSQTLQYASTLRLDANQVSYVASLIRANPRGSEAGHLRFLLKHHAASPSAVPADVMDGSTSGYECSRAQSDGVDVGYSCSYYP